MGDRKSTKQPINHVRKFLKFAINSSEELKDESYIQLLRQINQHKDYDKCIRGWNFFSILASCYAPSLELYYSILNFLLNEHKINSDKNIIQRVNYIIVRLFKSFENRRTQIPSDEEIMHIEVINFYYSEYETYHVFYLLLLWYTHISTD